MAIIPDNRPFFIALLLAFLFHSLLFLQFGLLSKPIKPPDIKQKPLMIEFIDKKTKQVPKKAELLSESNQVARVQKVAKKEKIATRKRFFESAKVQKKPSQELIKSETTPKKRKIKPVKLKPLADGTKKIAKKKKLPSQAKLKLSPSISRLAKRAEIKQVSRGVKKREATIDLSTQQFKYVDYFAVLKRIIKMRWIYPIQAQLNKTVGVTQLIFSVNEKGELLDISLTRPSGRKILDQSALLAIRQSVPLPPLPKEWDLDKINIIVNFEYVL
ncbi:MAG: TonB family protein [Magnetococcales bacterium]|nr:TonB family protein [Magnetococcales bacterium]